VALYAPVSRIGLGDVAVNLADIAAGYLPNLPVLSEPLKWLPIDKESLHLAEDGVTLLEVALLMPLSLSTLNEECLHMLQRIHMHIHCCVSLATAILD
jgi:hypothetical protein